MKLKNNKEDLDIDEMAVLKWILKNGCEGVDWILVAQDRDKWQALMHYRIT
jgi:hypothetical protein